MTPRPVGLAYLLALVMAAIVVYCIGRLAVARRLGRDNHVDVNVSHVLMGVAMVGMLVPRFITLPNGVWELVFGGFTLYFLVMGYQAFGARRSGTPRVDRAHPVSHYVIHMVMSVAMLYMFHVGMPTFEHGGAMAMASRRAPISDPGLTLLLITVLFASAAWEIDVVSRGSQVSALALADAGSKTASPAVAVGPPGGAGGGSRPFLAPRLEIACHVAMCVTMGYMLILMV